jgi:hypothetical protein
MAAYVQQLAFVALICVVLACAPQRPQAPLVVTVGPAFSPPLRAGDPPDLGATVDLSDNRRTVDLRAGQRLVVRLGQYYNWRVAISGPPVVEFESSGTSPDGQAVVFRAVESGRTRIVADGQPTCKQVQPRCNEPARSFSVDVSVN